MPKKTTPNKTGKLTRKKRSHIPALDEANLTVALQNLQSVNITDAGKQQIEEMLRAAANPAGESPEAVIQTLPRQRQRNIRAMERDMKARFTDVAGRGGAALMAMDEAEFNRLVEAAANEP